MDVGELIAGIVATHEAFVADSGLTLAYERKRGVRVLGDADMIRQATANLISNAVRYTPEGGHISVRVKKGDIMASIAVQDTGIGLSPEEAKMVFSRFWRADAGRTRESGGLGIGLCGGEGDRRPPRRLGAGGRQEGRGGMLHHPPSAVLGRGAAEGREAATAAKQQQSRGKSRKDQKQTRMGRVGGEGGAPTAAPRQRDVERERRKDQHERNRHQARCARQSARPVRLGGRAAAGGDGPHFGVRLHLGRRDSRTRARCSRSCRASGSSFWTAWWRTT